MMDDAEFSYSHRLKCMFSCSRRGRRHAAESNQTNADIQSSGNSHHSFQEIRTGLLPIIAPMYSFQHKRFRHFSFRTSTRLFCEISPHSIRLVIVICLLQHYCCYFL